MDRTKKIPLSFFLVFFYFVYINQYFFFLFTLQLSQFLFCVINAFSPLRIWRLKVYMVQIYHFGILDVLQFFLLRPTIDQLFLFQVGFTHVTAFHQIVYCELKVLWVDYNVINLTRLILSRDFIIPNALSILISNPDMINFHHYFLFLSINIKIACVKKLVFYLEVNSSLLLRNANPKKSIFFVNFHLESIVGVCVVVIGENKFSNGDGGFRWEFV